VARFIEVYTNGGNIKLIKMELISSIEIILDTFNIIEERKGFSYSCVSVDICFLNQNRYSNIVGSIYFNADDICFYDDYNLLINSAIVEL